MPRNRSRRMTRNRSRSTKRESIWDLLSVTVCSFVGVHDFDFDSLFANVFGDKLVGEIDFDSMKSISCIVNRFQNNTKESGEKEHEEEEEGDDEGQAKLSRSHTVAMAVASLCEFLVHMENLCIFVFVFLFLFLSLSAIAQPPLPPSVPTPLPQQLLNCNIIDTSTGVGNLISWVTILPLANLLMLPMSANPLLSHAVEFELAFRLLHLP